MRPILPEVICTTFRVYNVYSGKRNNPLHTNNSMFILFNLIYRSITMTTSTKATKATKATKTTKKDTPKEIVVLFSKGGTGKNAHITSVNVLSYGVVTPSMLGVAGDTMTYLCANLLAGTVDPDIIAANSVRGRLKKMFPQLDNPTLDRLRKCLDVTPEVLRAKWTIKFHSMKRVTAPTLDGLKSALATPKEKEMTLKDKLLEWINSVQPATLKDLPVKLYDILVDIMPEK